MTSVQQRREHSAKPDQDQTVDVPQPNARSSAVECQQLLAQGENLRLTQRASLEKRPQGEQNTSEPRQHRAVRLAHSRGFVTRDEILTSDSAGEPSKGPPAGLTASMRCAPKLQRLSGRRSDERGTGRRQVAKQQRFSGW